jgi:hypothetical protein
MSCAQRYGSRQGSKVGQLRCQKWHQRRTAPQRHPRAPRAAPGRRKIPRDSAAVRAPREQQRAHAKRSPEVRLPCPALPCLAPTDAALARAEPHGPAPAAPSPPPPGARVPRVSAPARAPREPVRTRQPLPGVLHPSAPRRPTPRTAAPSRRHTQGRAAPFTSRADDQKPTRSAREGVERFSSGATSPADGTRQVMHDAAASSNRNHTRGRQRARARHAACCTQPASGSAV